MTFLGFKTVFLTYKKVLNLIPFSFFYFHSFYFIIHLNKRQKFIILNTESIPLELALVLRENSIIYKGRRVGH